AEFPHKPTAGRGGTLHPFSRPEAVGVKPAISPHILDSRFSNARLFFSMLGKNALTLGTWNFPTQIPHRAGVWEFCASAQPKRTLFQREMQPYGIIESITAVRRDGARKELIMGIYLDSANPDEARRAQ